MELKEYQQRALDSVESYLRQLRTWREEYEGANERLRSAMDFPKAAWEGVSRGPYESKVTGSGEPLPNFCLKVPTGGGKTYLAVRALDRVQTIYRQRHSGLVLWIVPTDQIYRQTLISLQDRTHPYRQFLDIATGGRVQVVEKTDHFTPQDVRERLVILLLMLPSANRRDKETLKVFQDAAGFEGFFPDDGHREEHEALIQRWPNLDYFGAEADWTGRQVKSSLGNVLRILSPVIVLDEGQRAYSEGAQTTIRGFNPCLVLELSATPPKGSNILVNVRGRELDQEQMIKLELHVANRASTDWRDTLADSLSWRNLLEEEARKYGSATGTYIRPICLIQVERTGRDQIEADHIHAEHVKDELIRSHGVPESHVAIKSSEKDDIEGTDLLSPDCEVRYIITKQALQEGWDCPFAYVLTVLANPSSRTALTQLVGRILRQPYARKTGVESLDESYVFCFRREATELSRDIKQGLEGEGLGDLAQSVVVSDKGPQDDTRERRTVGMRDRFKRFEGKLYLPKFLIQEGAREDEVSYEMDLLPRVRWEGLSLERIATLTLSEKHVTEWEQSFGYGDDGDTVTSQDSVVETNAELNVLFLSRRIESLVSNPWIARAIVDEALRTLRRRYADDLIAANQVLIADELEKTVASERDRLCEGVFRELVEMGVLRLVLMSTKAYRVPDSIEIPKAVQPLYHTDGKQIQLSLYEDPVPKEWFNETLEAPVALCLDRQEKLLFWFRNLSSRDYFYVQGWRKNRIWADYVAAKRAETDEQNYDTIYVLETKGDQLAGNDDTQYKTSVFDLCNKLSWNAVCEEFPGKKVRFQVIKQSEWERMLNELLR
jgi:type III restriction enzyme